MLLDITKADVFFNKQKVGILALIPSKRKVAFSYDKEWIKNGFSLNPFSLPLKEGVFIPSNNDLDGLFGVFYDSLPDSWGKLLSHRYLKSKDINPESINILTSLTLINESSFGGLSYIPNQSLNTSEFNINDLDKLSKQFHDIFINDNVDDINNLFVLGGSSGGSRPKIYVKINNEEWIIKFPHHSDNPNIGEIEYNYMLSAQRSGIQIPEIRLIKSNKNKYFAIKRFDRLNDKRIHALSASSLLEKNYNDFLLDYRDLFKLTEILTKGNKEQLKQIYLLMCFNIIAKNQDDHGKNFTFIFNDITKKWSLAPAYDLTYSLTQFGEQSTTVNGKGKNIYKEDLVKLGTEFDIPKKECIALYEKVKNEVNISLTKYWD